MVARFRVVGAGQLAAIVAVAVLQVGVHTQTGPNPYRSVDGLQAGQGPGRHGGRWAKLPAGRTMGSPGGLESTWTARTSGRSSDAATTARRSAARPTATIPTSIRSSGSIRTATSFPSSGAGCSRGHTDCTWTATAISGSLRRGRTNTGAPKPSQADRTSGVQVLSAGQAAHDARRGGRAGKRLVALHGAERRRHRRRTATSSSWTATVRPATTASSSFRRTARSSRPSVAPDTGPASCSARTPLPWTASGRLFVADRGNQRIVIFDQDGKYLSQMDAVRHAERHRDRWQR